MKRTAFFISDGTGITAETLGQSLLAQFETIDFTKLTRPYIDSVEKARAMVQQINSASEKDGARPIIFDTIVNQDIRDVLAESDGYMIDIFSTFLAPLEQELTSHSSYSVGKSHSIGHNSNYMERIEAVNFALDNVDVALAALSFCADMEPGSGEGVFALARCAGWIAHALEQYEQPTFMRARVDYVGPKSGSSRG
jgi:regulator of PEP synthase PpsR (kinase-PPPase family)